MSASRRAAGAPPRIDSPDLDDLPSWARPEWLRGRSAADIIQVDRVELRAFAAGALRRAGARPSDARLTAETLVLADGRGHPSHGVSRLRQYLRLCDGGSVDPGARYEVLVRKPALEAWSGHRGLGPAIGHRAMDRAIARARRTGLAAVVVRDTGHYGIAGAYVLRAMAAGLIGISACNTEKRVAPTGATEAGLGTNPIAIGAPDGQGRGFLLDMATSVVALGKIEIRMREGRDIPPGWALDQDGRPTTDAASALAGVTLPLGGAAETSGYKGYGLGAAVELLTGLLGGGAFGAGVTGLWDTGLPSAISQLHLALDPDLFGAAALGDRLRAWRRDLAALRRQPGVAEILLPGDPEWRADERQAERIDVLISTLYDLATIAVERDLGRSWRRFLEGARSHISSG